VSRDRARRLDRLLKIERLKERALENRLKACAEERNQIERHAALLNGAVDDEVAAMQRALGVSRSVEELKRQQRYLDTVRSTLDRVDVERERVDRAFEASRADWQRQRRRRDAMTDMSARALAQAERAQTTREEYEVDDLASGRGDDG